MIDWTKITDSEEVIELLKERERIEEKIKKLDDAALVMYEIEKLGLN